MFAVAGQTVIGVDPQFARARRSSPGRLPIEAELETLVTAALQSRPPASPRRA
jgi:hypothetical protein